jgi:hypothetical protein
MTSVLNSEVEKILLSIRSQIVWLQVFENIPLALFQEIKQEIRCEHGITIVAHSQGFDFIR